MMQSMRRQIVSKAAIFLGGEKMNAAITISKDKICGALAADQKRHIVARSHRDIVKLPLMALNDGPTVKFGSAAEH